MHTSVGFLVGAERETSAKFSPNSQNSREFDLHADLLSALTSLSLRVGDVFVFPTTAICLQFHVRARSIFKLQLNRAIYVV